MDDQMIPTEDFAPEFELPENPVENPAPLPEYVTKADMEAMLENLASKFPQPTTTTATQVQTDTQAEVYEKAAEIMYTDPKGALQMIAAHAKEEAKREVLAQLSPAVAPMLNDFYGRSATEGLSQPEADYIRSQIQAGAINPQALQDPNVRAIVMDAAKWNAQGKGVPAPQAEGSIGMPGISYRDPAVQSTKTNFESIFGMKFNEAIKEI